MGTGYSDFITENRKKTQHFLIGDGDIEIACETEAVDISKIYYIGDEKDADVGRDSKRS